MRSMIVVLLSLIAVCWAGRFTQTDKNQILNAHNVVRAQIARGVFKAKGKLMPPAKNMYKLVWGPAIEATAQAHANKCIFEHSGAAGAGENLYMMMRSGITSVAGSGSAATNAWWKEFQDFGWASINLTSAAFNSGIGHATQNAWSTTRNIGCGAQICNGATKLIVVCQYKTPGNFINRNIYTQGPRCTACPAGTKCVTAGVLAGLCA